MQERLGVWTCCLGVLECSLEEACRLHRVPPLAVLRCRQGMAGKLREAAARGNTKEVLQLLEEGAKVTPDEHGRNALHLAASAGHPDVVAALLLAGTDVNITDSAGCTALQRAAADGHLEVVRQLVQHGADVNHQDIVHGNTALHEASWKGFSRCVAALCKAKANLHLKNCGGFAALHLCCQNGHNQSCRELLLAGCSPNLQNNYGDTPLHTSARYGHAGVTRILISANCRVSDQNKNGDTALHIAAAMGRRKLTRILLEAGCDKALKNKQNETAQDIATRKDLNEILVLLKSPTATHVANARARSQSKAQGQGQSQVQGTSQGRSDKNDKKREKNESGTSSKDSSTRHKDKKKHKNGHKVHFEKPVGRHWSPYGCHYYPDPKAFPQPNLDSLPREPLKKGEQYYLDLAGNIRKGPVGVGYTCYCAPFFRHMEARLDRDKQELKEHIDMAHQRLDQKVSSLERRTQGRLAELTRCVVAERTLCDRRHQHLTQWLTRGGMGRSSERARCPEDMVPAVPRARSLELLLDERGDEHDIGAMAVASNGRDHNRSFDALLDRGVGLVPLRGHPHRRSANDFPVPKTNIDHNRSFDTLLDARQDHQHHYRSANELPVTHMHDAHHDYPRSPGPHNRSFDVLLERPPRRGQSHKKVPVTDDSEDRMMGRISVSPNTCQDGNMSDEEQPSDWRGQPLRRSVQEMVARIQNAQAQHAPPPWACQSQGTRRRLEPEVRSQRQDDGTSESSEGEGDDDVNQRLPAAPDYENISACPWRPEESRLVSGLPYRSRSAVYSPTHDTDVHNDSGYSTKLYGSSKGPSPSLSGQLECEGILPSQRAMYNAHTGHSGQRKRYDHGDDPGASNIVAASLV